MPQYPPTIAAALADDRRRALRHPHHATPRRGPRGGRVARFRRWANGWFDRSF